MIGPISLPWPDKTLSPNARVHWARKSRAVKDARVAAMWAVRAVITEPPSWAGVAVSMLFCPPDKRRRDRDNMIASMKSATDGIADAIGIDDSQFVCTYAVGAPVRGGSVLVTLSPIGAS